MFVLNNKLTQMNVNPKGSYLLLKEVDLTVTTTKSGLILEMPTEISKVLSLPVAEVLDIGRDVIGYEIGMQIMYLNSHAHSFLDENRDKFSIIKEDYIVATVTP